MKVLYLITARGGSKGLPGKNLATIGGLSLVGFKARSAQAAPSCARLILSTDSAEVRAEGRTLGVEVPFARPSALAQDDSTSDSVVGHAMDWIEQDEGRAYDAIMILEPASPFATTEHYEDAVELFQDREADLVVGMRESEPNSVFVGELKPDGSISHIAEKVHALRSLRRQDQPVEVTMNGALYLVGWDAFRITGSIYGKPERSFGLLMDRYHSIEIENEGDLARARYAVEMGLIDLGEWSAV